MISDNLIQHLMQSMPIGLVCDENLRRDYFIYNIGDMRSVGVLIYDYDGKYPTLSIVPRREWWHVINEYPATIVLEAHISKKGKRRA